MRIVIVIRISHLECKIKFVNLSRRLNTLRLRTEDEPDREDAAQPVGEDVVENDNFDEFGWESR